MMVLKEYNTDESFADYSDASCQDSYARDMCVYDEPTVEKKTLVCLLHKLKDYYIFDIGFKVRNFRNTIKGTNNLTTCCCPCGNSDLWLGNKLGNNKLCIPGNDQCKSTKWYMYQGLIQHLKGSK